MTTPELIEFVRRDLALGTTREAISEKLKLQGWTDLDITEAFEGLSPVAPIEQPKVSEPVQSFTPAEHHIFSPMHPEIPIYAANSDPISAINTMNSHLPPKTNLGKKILKIFIILVAIILILVGGFIVYASGYFTSQSKMFSQSINSSKNNKSVAFEADVLIDASNIKLPEGSIGIGAENYKTFNFNTKGAFDSSDDKNLKFNDLFYFKTGSIEAEVDSRLTDGSLYLALTKAPNLGFFSLKPYENKWIVFKKPENGKDSDSSMDPLLSMSPVNTDFASKLTDEQKVHISEIVAKSSFVKITKKHLPQMINGKLSYHFDFDLDKEGIISFVKEMSSYLKSLDSSNTMNDSFEIKDEDYNKAFSYFKNFKGEAFIGVFDKLPYKIVVNTDIVNPEKLEDGSAKFTMTINYSDWGKPVNVIVPNGAVSIEEFMKSMFGGISLKSDSNTENNDSDNSVVVNPQALENTKIKESDATIKSILSSMRVQAELYYDSHRMSYKGYCRDKGDNGAYQSAIKLPKGTDYRCNDLSNSWLVWSKLSTGEYHCVDSTGIVVDMKMVPSGTSCKK